MQYNLMEGPPQNLMLFINRVYEVSSRGENPGSSRFLPTDNE